MTRAPNGMRYVQHDYLVIAKTYPNPSEKYRETSCVAAVSRDRELRRLYPIPYRFLGGDQQFSKWEWIRAQARAPRDDRRPESRRVDLDSLVRLGHSVSTESAWARRMHWLAPHVVPCFADLEERRIRHGLTLGVLRVARITALSIEATFRHEWTKQELTRLRRDGLFDTVQAHSRPTLRKLPFRFYYEYEIDTCAGVERNRHMVTDWEIGSLYFNCQRQYGAKWEESFRKKLTFAGRDLLFVMGTVHRFPDQWLIVGLVYPPKTLATITEPPLPGLGV